jgi:hypothetical protein
VTIIVIVVTARPVLPVSFFLDPLKVFIQVFVEGPHPPRRGLVLREVLLPGQNQYGP